MIKNNPKKNYSLKGKPLLTKIAFVVICVFIFSLFLGSFGGLLYLGRSCSLGISTVAADGVGGGIVENYEGNVTLEVSTIQYQIDSPVNNDHSIISGFDFQLYFPFEIFNTEYINAYGYNSELYFNTRSFSSPTEWTYNSVDLLSMELDDVVGVDSGCIDLYFFETCNIAFAISYVATSAPAIYSFSRVSYCEWAFNPSVSDNLTLYIYDANGYYKYFEIYPAVRQGGFTLNPLTEYSARLVYMVTDFNFTAVDEAYNQGKNDALLEAEGLLNEYYDRGFEEGERRGKILGASEAGNYTFASLLDAVFYAPTKMFVSLFNFDFLGVNVLGFVSTIITIIVAFGVIKFFL